MGVCWVRMLFNLWSSRCRIRSRSRSQVLLGTIISSIKAHCHRKQSTGDSNIRVRRRANNHGVTIMLRLATRLCRSLKSRSCNNNNNNYLLLLKFKKKADLTKGMIITSSNPTKRRASRLTIRSSEKQLVTLLPSKRLATSRSVTTLRSATLLNKTPAHPIITLSLALYVKKYSSSKRKTEK